MSLASYGDLQTAIANWLIRPGDPAITGSIPDMIAMFEEEARDRLKTRFNETTATLTTVAGTATVAQPAIFYELRTAVLQGSPNTPLQYLTPEQAEQTWNISSYQDQPLAITTIGQNFKLYPTPDAVYTIDIDYMQGLPALSESAPTNWLLTNYPSLYLVGSLAWAEAFIANDERIALWVAARDRAFDRLLTADRQARWSGGALQIKTDTGNP